MESIPTLRDPGDYAVVVYFDWLIVSVSLCIDLIKQGDTADWDGLGRRLFKDRQGVLERD